MKRNNIWLLGIFGWMACGSSNHIEVTAPGVVSGTVEVFLLKTNQSVTKKEVKNEKAQFTGAELGLEGIRLKLDHGYQALVTCGAELEQVNVNPLTTLAACRLQNKNIEQVDLENGLIAKQFLIADLHAVKPEFDLEELQELNGASIYGLLIRGFERLALNHNLSSFELVSILCEDVSFDGKFNAVDQKGSITSRLPWYDDQILKSELANAIYAYAEEEIKTFDQLPVAALANEISLSSQEGLFGETTLNYSFDL